MVALPKSDIEKERQKVLEGYNLFDREAGAEFDTILRLAVSIFGADQAAIAFVDSDREYYFARYGMTSKEAPRADGLCARAILDSSKALAIPDATQDPRFASLPWVTGEDGIRFCAAHPLTTPQGFAIGGLCLFGKKPKALSEAECENLARLAAVIMDILEKRKTAIENECLLRDARATSLSALENLKKRKSDLVDKSERFHAALTHMTQGLCMFDKDQRLIVCNKPYADMHSLPPELTQPGTPLSQIVRHRVDTGIFAGEDPESYIRERQEWGENPKDETKIHRLSDGRTISIARKQLPDGGWVATHEDVTARKYAEEALQESERHFRNLIEGSLQGVFIVRDWKLLFANQALADMFGYDSAEEILALGESGPLIAPGERQRISQYKTARERDEPAPEVYESRGLRKDGTEFWIEFRVRKVDWRGSPAMQCVVLDIDTRKRAEEQLRVQNRHFQAALDNMTQGLCMFDNDRKLIVCNRRYAEMHKLPPELTQRGTAAEDIDAYRLRTGLYAGEHVSTYAREQSDWLKNPKPVTLTFEFSDGSTVFAVRKPMQGGGWVSTHEDVTTLRRAQNDLEKLNAKLAAEERRIRKLYRHTPVMMHSIDKNGVIVDASEYWFDVMGYSREEVIGCKSTQFLTEESQKYAVETVLPAFWKNGYCKNVAYKMVKKDGAVIDARLSAIVDTGTKESGPVSLACVVDVTDQVRAERELIEHRDKLQAMVNEATAGLKAKAQELETALAREKELNELQRQFVSMASHEFRTPLAIIDSTAQRLKKRLAKGSPEGTMKRVDKIRSAVERMTRLMESTLTAARLEDGKIAVELEACNVGAIVKEVCARHREIATQHTITCELDGLPHTIKADVGALDQMLTNLLSNAVKYSPDASDIQVKAYSEGSDVVLQVRDHGLGIDAEDLPNMFSRFYRAKSSYGIAGTGIGLSLVKTLAEMHGGSVGVESARHEGSTFTVRLPADGPVQAEQAA